MKENINSFVLGASIVFGSYLLYCGIDNYAHKDRFVSVKVWLSARFWPTGLFGLCRSMRLATI